MSAPPFSLRWAPTIDLGGRAADMPKVGSYRGSPVPMLHSSYDG